MLKWLWRWLVWPCSHDWYVLVESDSVPLHAALKANDLSMHGKQFSMALPALRQLVGASKTKWLACKKCGELKKITVNMVGMEG